MIQLLIAATVVLRPAALIAPGVAAQERASVQRAQPRIAAIAARKLVAQIVLGALVLEKARARLIQLHPASVLRAVLILLLVSRIAPGLLALLMSAWLTQLRIVATVACKRVAQIVLGALALVRARAQPARLTRNPAATAATGAELVKRIVLGATLALAAAKVFARSKKPKPVFAATAVWKLEPALMGAAGLFGALALVRARAQPAQPRTRPAACAEHKSRPARRIVLGPRLGSPARARARAWLTRKTLLIAPALQIPVLTLCFTTIPLMEIAVALARATSALARAKDASRPL